MQKRRTWGRKREREEDVGEEKLLIIGSTELWLSKLMLLLVDWETVWKNLSLPSLRGCKKEELEEEREREEESLTCTSKAFISILRDSNISGLCFIAWSRKSQDVLWIDLKKSSKFLVILSFCKKKGKLSTKLNVILIAVG